MVKTLLNIELDKLNKECEEMRANWNGDESGRLEEIADTAHEIQEKIKELKELLDYLNEFHV